VGSTPLFTTLDRPAWTPTAPPSLEGITILALDVETDGLRWWDGHRPIGLSVTLPSGHTQYLPWGHRGGGNLNETTVKRWAQRELRGKHIVNLNTKFDVHMLRVWGVDLEAQGCTVSDVAHSAALLDDARQRFSLDALSRDFLGQEKIGKDLSYPLSDHHAGTVAPRAESDTKQVWALDALFDPQLTDQDLQKVKAVENQIIYVVCEMEKNGTPVNVELLQDWLKESEQQYLRALWQIYRETNRTINPASPKDLEKLFAHLNLPIVHTPDGRPSFTDEVLASHHDPLIDKIRTARRLASLRSKYLLKYEKGVGSDGVLRYALHQLRAMAGPLETRSAGTVTGRFSSTAIDRGVGINIQQVMTPAKQIAAFGTDQFLIRQLHRPAAGQWLSADAMQIEYRLFAAEAKNPRVLEAYAKNPLLSFHRLVWDEVKKLKPDITYKQQKNLNFAKLYGAGTIKIAYMLDLITAEDVQTLREEQAKWDHPKLQGARHAMDIYARVLPEVGLMLKRSTMAAQTAGYVTTILGRRARYTDRYYKALNSRIQGSAADLLKLKLIALHDARKETGFVLRFTVHDEVDGDAPDQTCVEAVHKILDDQAVPLAVPILWDVSTGKTWGECE